jgi:hypothetical protein
MDALYNMLQDGTAKGRLLAEQYRSDGQFNPICEHVTKVDCVKAQVNDGVKDPRPCDRVSWDPEWEVEHITELQARFTFDHSSEHIPTHLSDTARI